MASKVLLRHATIAEQHVLSLHTDESAIARIRQLYLLSGPLEFTLVGNNFGYGNSKSTILVDSQVNNQALANRVMRKGRYYATFVVANKFSQNEYEGTLGVSMPLPGWDNDNRWVFLSEQH